MISDVVLFTEFIQVYTEIKAKRWTKRYKRQQFVEEEKILSKLKCCKVCADRQTVTLSSKHPTFKGLKGRQLTQGSKSLKYTFVWKETAWTGECSWGKLTFFNNNYLGKYFPGIVAQVL